VIAIRVLILAAIWLPAVFAATAARTPHPPQQRVPRAQPSLSVTAAAAVASPPVRVATYPAPTGRYSASGRAALLGIPNAPHRWLGPDAATVERYRAETGRNWWDDFGGPKPRSTFP
jgi:hypothetical protein